MRVQNSSRLPNREVLSLVDAVAGHFACATMARLLVEDADTTSVLGATWKFSPTSSRYDFIAPSLVRLFIPRTPIHPRHDRYRVEHEGKVVTIGEDFELLDLQEEIALVLAHELRHVDQFWAGAAAGADHIDFEVDAELFARRVVAARRTHKVRRTTG